MVQTTDLLAVSNWVAISEMVKFFVSSLEQGPSQGMPWKEHTYVQLMCSNSVHCTLHSERHNRKHEQLVFNEGMIMSVRHDDKFTIAVYDR